MVITDVVITDLVSTDQTADKKVLTELPPGRGGGGFGGPAPLPESGLIGPVRILSQTLTP